MRKLRERGWGGVGEPPVVPTAGAAAKAAPNPALVAGMALMLALGLFGAVALHHLAFHLAVHFLAALVLALVLGVLTLLMLSMLCRGVLRMIDGSSRCCLSENTTFVTLVRRCDGEIVHGLRGCTSGWIHGCGRRFTAGRRARR